MQTYRLEVGLSKKDPYVRRTFLVSSEITLNDLQEVLQIVMGGETNIYINLNGETGEIHNTRWKKTPIFLI